MTSPFSAPLISPPIRKFSSKLTGLHTASSLAQPLGPGQRVGRRANKGIWSGWQSARSLCASYPEEAAGETKRPVPDMAQKCQGNTMTWKATSLASGNLVRAWGAYILLQNGPLLS